MAVEGQTIWHELHGRLRAFIVSRVGNQADADDILQDVFLRIHRHADTLDRADRFQAWVYQITRNAIVDYYRAPIRRREAPLEDAAEPGRLGASSPADDDSGSEEARQHMAACLAPMIDRLPEKYRQAIVLTELEGVSQVIAAERLGLSVSGMKARVQRARQRLKAVLLDCCHIELDRRGGIVDFEDPSRSCAGCGQGPGPPS